MITDRLQDIAVTNSLRHRRRERMVMMMTTTTKKTSISSSRAEKIIKRRERTRSYQRYKLSSLTLKAMKNRVGRKRRSGNKETDDGCMLLQRRRVLRRPSTLQSLTIHVYHPTEKRPYIVSSHTSHSTGTDTPLIDTATSVQTITDPHHSRPFAAPALCYRLSTHIWHAKRMAMQRITCRVPGGSKYSEQRCVYVPSRHRGRGLKAVLKVIEGSNRSVDEKDKDKENGDTSGVASEVCIFMFMFIIMDYNNGIIVVVVVVVAPSSDSYCLPFIAWSMDGYAYTAVLAPGCLVPDASHCADWS
jgi:hypothetical protein